MTIGLFEDLDDVAAAQELVEVGLAAAAAAEVLKCCQADRRQLTAAAVFPNDLEATEKSRT